MGNEPKITFDPEDPSAALAVLAHPVRRAVIDVLADEGGSASLGTVLDRVAERTARDRDRLAVVLHHRHLPKLTDGGAVDREGDRLRMTPGGETAASLTQIVGDYV